MATRSIGIDFTQYNLAPFPTGWNRFSSNPTAVGVLSSDLSDLSGALTGISVAIDSPFRNQAASSNFSDGAAHHGWPQTVWEGHWVGQRYDADPVIPGRLRFGGFTPGQQGSFALAGHKNNAEDSLYIVNGGDSVTYTGTAAPPASPVNLAFAADSNGEVTLAVSNGAGVDGLLSGLILTYTESATPPTSIDQLISGETSTATFAEPFAATSATVSDGTTSFSGIAVTGSGTSWSFTAPTITDLATGLKLGNVSVTFTDGTDTTAGYSIAYQLSGYTAANITSVSDFALGVYFDPPTEVGDQFAYQADKGKVETNGEWNDGGIEPPFVGTQTLWHYSSVDQTWRDFELTTTGDGSEPEPEPPGDSIGMTRRNITRRAFTRRAQTSRGMTS